MRCVPSHAAKLALDVAMLRWRERREHWGEPYHRRNRNDGKLGYPPCRRTPSAQIYGKQVWRITLSFPVFPAVSVTVKIERGAAAKLLYAIALVVVNVLMAPTFGTTVATVVSELVAVNVPL